MANPKFIFCGSSFLSMGVLEALKKENIFPELIITNPDKKSGRGLELTENIVAVWARENKIQTLKPEKSSEIVELLKTQKESCDFCLVASYGKILSKEFLDFFENKVFNLHPSDLPLYRGPSPIESQILDELESFKVSIIHLSQKMDAGDILTKDKFILDLNLQKNIEQIEKLIGETFGLFFYKTVVKFLNGEIVVEIQEDSQATYTRKYKKIDGDISSDIKNKIDLKDIYRKFVAFNPWPGIFFEHKYLRNGEEQSTKVKVTDMDETTFLTLMPEGKKQNSLEEFQRNFGNIF